LYFLATDWATIHLFDPLTYTYAVENVLDMTRHLNNHTLMCEFLLTNSTFVEFADATGIGLFFSYLVVIRLVFFISRFNNFFLHAAAETFAEKCCWSTLFKTIEYVKISFSSNIFKFTIT